METEGDAVPAEVPPGPKGKDILWPKIAAGIAMAALVSLGIYVDYLMGLDVFFAVIVLVVGLKALAEFYQMCESSRTGPFRGFGMVSAGLLVVFHWVAVPGTLERFAEKFGFEIPLVLDALVREELVRFGLVAAILGSIWLQATKRDNDRTFEAISSTLFGILYIWFLSSFLVRIRHLGADGVLGGEGWNRTGTVLLISCIAVSKFADVGGYLIGRKIGRTKMIPRISPNKTYEGLAAGELLSIGIAFGLWRIGMLPFEHWWSVLIFGIVVSGMGVLGDLAESLLKRGSGRKDADKLVPGFGGVLDVIDSLLISAPVGYVLSVVLLRAGV